MATTKGILASSHSPRGGSRLLKSSAMRGCCCRFCWAPGGSTRSVAVDPAEDASKHRSMGCPHHNTRSSRAQKGREVLTSLAQQRASWTQWPDHTKTHGDGLFYSHLQSFSRRRFNDMGKCSWGTKLKKKYSSYQFVNRNSLKVCIPYIIYI